MLGLASHHNLVHFSAGSFQHLRRFREVCHGEEGTSRCSEQGGVEGAKRHDEKPRAASSPCRTSSPAASRRCVILHQALSCGSGAMTSLFFRVGALVSNRWDGTLARSRNWTALNVFGRLECWTCVSDAWKWISCFILPSFRRDVLCSGCPEP